MMQSAARKISAPMHCLFRQCEYYGSTVYRFAVHEDFVFGESLVFILAVRLRILPCHMCNIVGIEI